MGKFFFIMGALTLHAQDEKNFVAALGGFAILSGDAQTSLGTRPSASSYSSRNGAALNLAAGRHWNDWLSVQGNYIWNRNEVTLNGVAGSAFYSSLNQSHQHQWVADGLLYFRPLSSRIRPYLSTGIAAVKASREQTSLQSAGVPDLPAARRAIWTPGLRVAVGVDLMLPNRWGFRYSFSETLSRNLFSQSLKPRGTKSLMNFHHLFGVVKYF